MLQSLKTLNVKVEVKKVKALHKKSKEAVSSIAAEIAAQLIEENSKCFAFQTKNVSHSKQPSLHKSSITEVYGANETTYGRASCSNKDPNKTLGTVILEQNVSDYRVMIEPAEQTFMSQTPSISQLPAVD